MMLLYVTIASVFTLYSLFTRMQEKERTKLYACMLTVAAYVQYIDLATR